MDAPVTEKKKPSIVAMIVLGLVIIAALALRAYDAWKNSRPILAEATLRGQAFTVEVADTDAKKELGLGKRDGMPADHGMYFPFGAAQYWIFWMKDMRFPIDIVWFRDGKVVDVSASVPVDPAGTPLKTYTPSDPADAVLELNAGAAARIGLQRGDALTLKAGG